jgi:ubiquinone/menaquinone biosynthesis C-methylase UbiE
MPEQMMPSNPSRTLDLTLHQAFAYRQATELEILGQLLPLAGSRVLELGCGRAWLTRRLAEDFAVAEVIATEVDRIQHEKNLAISDLPQVRFIYAGMESVPLDDASVDIAIMLKSLHHVPVKLMDRGFVELNRVLKPSGLAYVSEPVYAGDFNAILSLFNDEKQVREQAFAALCRAVEAGLFEHQGQHFFASPGHYANWEEFEDRLLKVTHTEHRIDEALYQRIKAAFEAHLGADGAHFLKPSRVDLLRRPDL